MARNDRYPSREARVLANSYAAACGCWFWTGARNWKGYGVFNVRIPGRKNPVGLKAHRVAWEALRGEKVPEGMTLDHTCGTQFCVNPAHMELVTRSENVQRMHARRKNA